ncbi:HIT zinc finger [Paragonimus heterotremus]|uniref:HIT zinc finger n=1 Tax=Paragonimus heterotremus TaxID=100268 RepID=A0A8J4TGX3_9TREM|nr:HIT zinc finger [Paragonimus heterotremus]
MSDSDSTWPATDDFGSRFLEVDEYVCGSIDDISVNVFPTDVQSQSIQDYSGSRGSQRSIRRHGEARTNRGLRLRSYIALEDDRDEEFEGESMPSGLIDLRSRRSRDLQRSNRVTENEESDSTSEFRSPRLLTARQLSLQMQRVAHTQSRAGTHLRYPPSESTLLSLESLEPVRPNSTPTPEQVAARQRSIARRRESAKRKAELQKRQTVERLLKVNADSDGFHRRGRGRGRSVRGLPHSASFLSTSSNMSNGADDPENFDTPNLSTNNGDAPELKIEPLETQNTEYIDRITRTDPHVLSVSSLDPPANYVRIICSSRLSPSTRVCLSSVSSVTDGRLSELFTTPKYIAPPITKLCAMGCGRLRRYTCSTTGQPLCSLACYKQNLTIRVQSPVLMATG